MNATYRLQLQPGFGFDAVRALLPYFKRLGISHLYLSPITEARAGSPHGYDVTDHNRIRAEFGGLDGFERLLEAVQGEGLSLILDFVPNHASVGPQNHRWQDVLAYGPHSPYASYFDIDWDPLKPELKQKVLLPYLEGPYGETLDRDEITIVYEEARFYAAYHAHRFALAPSTYAEILGHVLNTSNPSRARGGLKDLCDAYRGLSANEREQAEAFGARLKALAIDSLVEISQGLNSFPRSQLHALLERQAWRLAYWKTAASEVNYRRFFDVNELVALRMENAGVFAETHRLLAQLIRHQGIDGVRVDHIDGIFDPHQYLQRLKDLGTKHIWVEKILAHGETLPAAWPVEGTVGYEFLNDALGVLTWPKGEFSLDRIYRRFLRASQQYREEVHSSKRLVMETALSGELSRLAVSLDRISEANYHTRDFSLEALHEALAEIVAAFSRYRTYLPFDHPEAEPVVRQAVYEARQRNVGTEPTVYDFIAQVLLGDVGRDLLEQRAAWVGRFQQYTAEVTPKGIEDTALYRYVRLVALNEVGGEPDRFGTSGQAFHARARFRSLRYPNALVTTATHDHKRGEDTRMRLAVLAEVPDAWQQTLMALSRVARRHRSATGPSRPDEYLLFQTLVALWEGADREPSLTDRLVMYMRKAAREAKRRTSWLNPDPNYETALERFVRGLVADPRTVHAIQPLAGTLAHYGFVNGLSQTVLKATTAGVPDFYQGCELFDLSLVDPDNRRPVDFETRSRLLEELEPILARPADEEIYRLMSARDEKAKLYLIARLLRFRHAHPRPYAGSYRSLEAEGSRAEHLLAYTREAEDETLLVMVPRFMATLERVGGWGETRVPLPGNLAQRRWTEVLSGHQFRIGESVDPTAFPFPWAVLFSVGESPGAAEANPL